MRIELAYFGRIGKEVAEDLAGVRNRLERNAVRNHALVSEEHSLPLWRTEPQLPARACWGHVATSWWSRFVIEVSDSLLEL
jgi:hypothetical protein